MLRICILAALCAFSITAQAGKKKEIKSVPGEFVVKLKAPLAQGESMAWGGLLQSSNVEMVREDVLLVKKPVGVSSVQLMHELKSSDAVEIVEPNYIYEIVKTPNDPELGKLWGLDNSGAADSDGTAGVKGVDVGAVRAWDLSTGSKKVVVAVIDTGVDYTHPELQGNIWSNKAELTGKAGVDDDNNGYVDDVYGYDFANDDGDPMDDHAHGTHCSGTIGAKGDDGKGLVGVAWDVSIMGVKFLDGGGSGTLANAIRAIDYATKMKVNIMSNSWGGGGFSQTLKDSIERAEQAGILFTAAAGNETNDNDASASYPASYDSANIVSVAAVENRGNLAYFSNFGKTKVHVAAPGHNILSTVPGGHDTYSGTSMATPHVTGVAALLLAYEPTLTYAQIKERLVKTSKPIASLRGKLVAAGIVDAYHALTNTVPPPDANDPSGWAGRHNASVSTTHPYADSLKQSYTIKVPGAKRLAVHFSKFETESNYDKLIVSGGAGAIQTLSGNQTGAFTAVVDGDTVVLDFSSDSSVNGYGFDVDYVAYE